MWCWGSINRDGSKHNKVGGKILHYSLNLTGTTDSRSLSTTRSQVHEYILTFALDRALQGSEGRARGDNGKGI